MRTARQHRTVSRLFPLTVIFFCFLLPFAVYADTPAPTSLLEAYGQAPDGDIIKALDRSYEEDLTADRPVTLTLEGGYTDTTWTERPGFTTLQGNLVIVDGGLIIDSLIITSETLSISDVKVTPVTATSVSVTWSTDHPADSHVDYGVTDTYGSTATDNALATSHNVTFTGLSQGTTYHYKVTSTTSLGATASTADSTFATSDFAISTAADSGNVTVMEVTGTYDIRVHQSRPPPGDSEAVHPAPRRHLRLPRNLHHLPHHHA